MMICLRTVPSSAALVVCASTGPSMATASNRTARIALRKHPATALRHWADGLGSIFGVIGFMAIAFICIGPTFYLNYSTVGIIWLIFSLQSHPLSQDRYYSAAR